MELLQLSYRNSAIGYYRFGSGPKPALCFHGYGEEAGTFQFLASYAGNQYTFYSIDLPFHGKTEWKDGLNFTQSDLAAIIEEILKQPDSEPRTPNADAPVGIPTSFAASGLQTPNFKPRTSNFKLTLLGYSLGGRVSLSLCQSMPEKIEKIILLAPDGLKVNFWYWLATQSWAGNKLFRFTMKYPGWFFGFLKLLNKLKLVNTSIFKFVNYYIGDAEVRQSLYDRWTTLRKLKPDINLVKTYIRKNNIQVRLIYGKHDRIILSSVGERFKKGIEEFCTLSVIQSGHQVLHEKHIREILPALLH